MNIFEDLIEELKEENLLEETVIETSNLENQNTASYPLPNPPNELFETPPPPVFGVEIVPNTPDKPDLSGVNMLFSDNDGSPVINETISTERKEDLIPQFQPFQPGFQPINNQSVVVPPTVVSELPDFGASSFPEPAFPPVSQVNDSLEEPFEPVAFSKAAFTQTEQLSEVENQLVQNLVQANNSSTDLIIAEEEKLMAAGVLSLENKSELTEADFSLVHSSENPLLAKTVPTSSEFFRRRATEEVNSLQIVEHIISAIEREHLKVISKPYDDLSVSMALHDFLKLTENPNSIEHAQAEFKLMQETQNWYSALSQRDNEIPVEALRKYCENARPALSSQALISMARFYRNSPFSEAVRSKFEMVITRLLSKEQPDDTREMIFTREELIKQLENLYADWSSIPLYESNNDDSDVLIGVLKFEDFASEAVAASKFEELIKNDFFNRLRIYKESTGEKFFAPMLAATAVESNVVIGNRYVELIKQERERDNSKLLEEKYSFLLDQSVSDATSKTLQLVELLKEKKDDSNAKTAAEIHDVVAREHDKPSEAIDKSTKPRKFSYFSIAVIILSIVFLGGVYYWAEFLSPEMKTSPSVKKVNLDNSSLKEYFKTARISKNTFFAVTEPAWDRLSKDVKEDILKKTLAVGSEKGYDKIHLLNKEGKTVAFASGQEITIENK